MRRRALMIAALAAALALPIGARAQTGNAAPPAGAVVEVTTALSRTAAWVGDRIVYAVELSTLPGFDIVLEDVGQDRLRVEGGEVLSVEDDHEPGGARSVRRVRYTLVANRADVTAVRIPALAVRYYERRGDEPGPGAPAGQVIVPAAAVAIRSTLPEGGVVAGPRIPTSLRRPPRWLGLLWPIGITLVAATVLPVALYILRAGPRARAAWSRIEAMRERRRRRRSFADVKDLAPASDGDRIAAFERLDAFIRDHFEGKAGVPAFALTPQELRHALTARGEGLTPERVERLLETCERARYASVPPTAEEWVDAVRETEQILQP